MNISELMLKDYTNLENLVDVVASYNALKLEYNSLYLEKEKLKGLLLNKPEESKTDMEAKILKLEEDKEVFKKNIKNLMSRKLSFKERFFGKIMF